MDVQAEVNPYQSPRTIGHDMPTASEEAASKRIYIAWCVVYCLNLVLPFLFGWGMTEKGGRAGMTAAMALLFAVGLWLCANAPRIFKALLVGGLAVGLGQVLPALQFAAGIAAICVVEAVGLERPWGADDVPQLTNDLSGFVVTSITGALLMAAALVAGLAIRGLFSARVWR